jgi:hypothetical protein
VVMSIEPYLFTVIMNKEDFLSTVRFWVHIRSLPFYSDDEYNSLPLGSDDE